MLRVIEYFANSLKVIQNDTFEYGTSKCLGLFRCNGACLSLVRSTVSRTFSVK